MKIVQVCPQSDRVLQIVAEDGRMGTFDVRPYLADEAMEADGLTELDVAESILNAVAIHKTLRSQSPWRQQRTEYLHVIQSTNLDGLMIYTKGKLVEEAGVDRYYFLVSSKKAL